MPDLARAEKIPGWMSTEELTWLANAAGRCTSIIEIGAWRGRTTRAMADNSSAVIFPVDTWSDTAIGFPGWWTAGEDQGKYKKKDWLLHEFLKNLDTLVSTKVIPLRMTSVQAARIPKFSFMQFDMIFIDGDHVFASVVEDIKLWLPRLKPGGILCGHDYLEPTCLEVKPAVDSMLKVEVVAGTIWRAV